MDVYLLGSIGRGGATPTRLALAGVAVAAMLTGFTQGVPLLQPDIMRVVEFATSIGISTLFLAAAMRDNAAATGRPAIVVGSEIVPDKVATAREPRRGRVVRLRRSPRGGRARDAA